MDSRLGITRGTRTYLRRFALAVAVVAALLGANFAASHHLNPRASLLLVYVGFSIILAVSLNLINGFTGQFSLGHAGFMAVGAYVSATFTQLVWHTRLYAGLPLPPWLREALLLLSAIILGGTAASLVGLLVGLPTLRLRGDYLAIATLGFGEIVRIGILNMDVVGGARGYGGFPKLTNLFWVALWTILAVLLIRNLVSSIHGRALLAVREDEVAAEAVGVNTTRYKVLAFVIGAFFAGVAGVLFAHYFTYINPASFDFLKSIEVVVMVVLGGMGSITGSVTAATVLTLLREQLRKVGPYDLGPYRLVVYAVLLVALMLLRPQGLLGRWELSWQTFHRRPPEVVGGPDVVGGSDVAA